jgi:uncharacterized protein
MPIIVGFIILITFMGTSYPMLDLPKGDMKMFPNMKGNEQLRINQTVTPAKEFDFKNVEKQEFDYSCGSAALATLLNGYLGEKFTEQQVIQGLMNYGDAEKIQQRRAFSLLDMKRFVEVLGYNGVGYKAELDDIRALNKPAIIPLELSGYKHFVVYRGIYGNHIFISDPFRGNTSFTIDQFLTMWSQNIVFVVSSEAVRTNALRLKSEDLRLITYEMDKHALPPDFPPQTVENQWQVLESVGDTIYKTKNLK